MTATTDPVAAVAAVVQQLAPTPTAPAPLITIGPGPKNARTDPDSGLRFYRASEALIAGAQRLGLTRDSHPGGRDLPSVTSVRRMAGVPHGLHQWSITQVVNKALDNLGSIAARLSGRDPGQVAVVKTELRRAATEERDRAARLGTAVHDAAATGKALTAVPPDVAPRLRQYLGWLEASGAEILGSEFQCWNLGVGYAGTCDLMVRFPNGSIWVLDLKTGKGVYSEHALQLIAYLMGEFVGTDDVVDERLTALLRQATGMGVLHLADDHWEFRALVADPGTWTAFRGLVAFATWMHDHTGIDTVTAAARRSEAA